MNYLAHAYLSGENPEILIGNMMGDAIKGYGFLDKYPKNISTGILLHRFIDDFMDNHELTRQGKKRIWQNYRHYSGVVIDIYYDHLLAKNWSTIVGTNLDEYAEHVYGLLKENRDILPEETQYLSEHMIRHNWLGNYSDVKGIERTFQGLSRRTKFSNNMATATKDLLLYFDEFEKEFLSFFDDIQSACVKKLKIFESNG